MATAAPHINELSERGFTVVPGVFSADQLSELRVAARRAEAWLERQGLLEVIEGPSTAFRTSACDLLAAPDLRQVLLDPRVVALAEEILGCRPVYFGDSSIRFGGSVPEWHRDNVDRTDTGGPDWLEPYPLVRFGIYLQDHRTYSGALCVKPRSHLAANRGGGRFVGTAPGDVVIWSLRTLHAGDGVRLRLLPHVVLPPRLQRVLPRSACRPEQKERIALFFTFARPGPLFDRYLADYATKPYAVTSAARSQVDAGVVADVAAAGIDLRQLDGRPATAGG